MLTAHPSAFAQKKDLHVGGLGLRAMGAPAAVTHHVRDLRDARELHGLRNADESWLQKARATARDADDYLHASPWSSLAVVALVGLTAGFLLARRSPSP